MSRLSALLSSRLLRLTVSVASARALAQALMFLTTIVTAKFFNSADFGRVAFFVSLAQVAGMVVSFRIENAAIVRVHPQIRLQVFRLAYVLSLFVTIIITPVMLIYFLQMGAFSPLTAALFPIFVLFTSLTTYIWPLQLTAEHEIGRLNRIVVVNAVLSSLLQIAVSLLHATTDLLIAARVVSLVLAGLLAAPIVYLSFRQFDWRTDVKGLRRAARLAGPEIRFSLPTNLMFALSLQLPVFALTFTGQNSDAGLFWLASTLVIVPYSVVAASFRPIFVREMAQEARNPAKLAEHLTRATLYAGAIGLIGSLTVFAGSYVVIRFFLGTAWLPAIDFAAWLCVLLASMILQTPLSSASTTLKAQRDILWQQAAHLTFRFAGFFLGATIFGSSLGGVAGFSIGGTIVNIAFTILLIRKLHRGAGVRLGDRDPPRRPGARSPTERSDTES